MKQVVRTLSALALAAVLTLPASALGAGGKEEALARAGDYVAAAVPSPQVASAGGEWAVIGLARAGRLGQGQREAYLSALTGTLEEQQGVLSRRKYSEYARVVLALSALGEDPRAVAGYDLIAPLLDGDQVEKQGINGPIFALLALDSGDYGEGETKARYLEDILKAQLPDGGWALSGERSDPDVTAQALQALAPYGDGEASRAVERGISCLERLWEEGGFLTSESCAQALIACAVLGRPAPEGMAEELLSYQLAEGGFAHLAGGKSDLMASEQALCALCALARAERGLPALYDMAQTDPEPLALLLAARVAVPGPHPLAQAG